MNGGRVDFSFQHSLRMAFLRPGLLRVSVPLHSLLSRNWPIGDSVLTRNVTGEIRVNTGSTRDDFWMTPERTKEAAENRRWIGAGCKPLVYRQIRGQ